MTKAALKARYTGNKEIHFRWVGSLEGGELIAMQKHPSATVKKDTFSSRPDGRMVTFTTVDIDTGLVMLDVEYGINGKGEQSGAPTFVAGLIASTEPGNVVDYDRVKHVEMTKETITVDGKERNIQVHTIAVDGKHRRFTIGEA